MTDEFLVKWLFSGIPEPMCTLARSQELAKLHKAQFAPMLDAYRAAR